MTVTPSIDPARLLEEQLAQASPDLLRELLTTFINTLMSAEADAVCGAAYGQASPDRTNRRNGYRGRDFDTRAGTLDLAVPKLRAGSYFPEWLLERRKRAERALTSVVATCYLLGVSTRRMDKLVQSLGITTLSKSQVSQMAKDLDEHVEEFRTRRLEDAGPFTRARLSAVPLAIGASAAVVLGFAAPASAHVTITASTTAAGAFTVLTVSVPHGCDGSPTTEVAIQIPEGINSVTPTRNPLYDVEKQTEQLDPPITDGEGNEITERVATVTYTAKSPLPDGYRDAFELSLQLPDEEGETIVFPTIQTCEEGESAWIEVPEDGQSEDDLELPAPAVAITAATGDHHGSEEPEPAASEDASDLGPWALAAGVLGVLIGAFAVVQARRRP